MKVFLPLPRYIFPLNKLGVRNTIQIIRICLNVFQVVISHFFPKAFSLYIIREKFEMIYIKEREYFNIKSKILTADAFGRH